jgi:hypothetical protein
LGGEAEEDLEGQKGRVAEVGDGRHVEYKLVEFEGCSLRHSNDSHAEDVSSSLLLVEV